MTEPTRPIPLAELSTDPTPFSLHADAESRETLAKRYDVQDIASLSADGKLRKSGSMVRVEGHLLADLGRTCGVSLEPMREKIDEDFEVVFSKDRPAEVEGEVEADLDAPEPLEDDAIDLWAVVLEQLVLAMSPHPRKEGATPPEDPGKAEESSPFAVLKSLEQ
jgi:uncharacterized metal-binding protein YceD (DUF177 family)